MKKLILLIAIAFSFTAHSQSYQSLLKDFRAKAVEFKEAIKAIPESQLPAIYESNSELRKKGQAMNDALDLLYKMFPTDTFSGACELACGAKESICWGTCVGQACVVCVLVYPRCIANCGL